MNRTEIARMTKAAQDRYLRRSDDGMDQDRNADLYSAELDRIASLAAGAR